MFRPDFQHLPSIERRRIVTPPDVKLRWHRLEKPEPWPDELLDALRAKLPLDRIQQYPDYPPFYAQLAAFTGLREDQLVVGAGIEEFIRMLFLISAAPGEKVGYLWPTCAMFDVYAQAFQAEVVSLSGDHDSDVFALIRQLPRDLRLLILVNPGQPIETCYNVEQLTMIAAWCLACDCVLAIDEAYHGFGAPTGLDLIGRFPNVVVLRTFSKAWGMGAMRIGYAVAGPQIKASLDGVRQSGEVSGLSMAIASFLMDHHRYVQDSINRICKSRDWLREQVRKKLSLRAWGRFANHVLIELPDQGRALRAHNRLWEQDICVRGYSWSPLERHILVTCGSSMATTMWFFDQLREALR